MDSLEEMDRFLEMYNLSTLNEEEIENMNKPITSNEIESVILKSPGPDGFPGECYQTLKEELTPILLKLLQILQRNLQSPVFQTTLTDVKMTCSGK